ncbi:MAG: hypothetical protein IJA73_00080, partial [Oscillospiraceae bacterium]|nr:hypothetical protein [Oscillospiraceae bacterium]
FCKFCFIFRISRKGYSLQKGNILQRKQRKKTGEAGKTPTSPVFCSSRVPVCTAVCLLLFLPETPERAKTLTVLRQAFAERLPSARV